MSKINLQEQITLSYPLKNVDWYNKLTNDWQYWLEAALRRVNSRFQSEYRYTITCYSLFDDMAPLALGIYIEKDTIKNNLGQTYPICRCTIIVKDFIEFIIQFDDIFDIATIVELNRWITTGSIPQI